MNNEEYSRIVNMYIDDVKRVAYASCKNEYDSDDITQTVFLKFLNYQGSFEDDEHIKKWLIKVTVNECRSFWRSPWKERVLFWVPERIGKGISSESGENEVRNGINRLGGKYREVVLLYYYEEYSVREIAEILDLSEAAVLKRLQRARETLKLYLTKR